MQSTAIKIEDIHKTFKLPLEKQSSLKSIFVNIFRRRRGYELQKALDGISFDIKKGEFFGIVGRNGSGKSTLLKLIAGIYNPSRGQITINGSLTPFIELGVGFNPELTGRENIFLNGALLGFSRDEMRKMYKEIVEFAELDRFMDQKLKNYSSGMQVRLAFSIAIKAQSDILLIDEVLAVGDAAFQKKCFDYFMKLKKENKTVVFVTHDMSAARQYCDRGIMIENGKILKAGYIEKVAQAYQKMFNDELAAQRDTSSENDEKRWGTGKLKATKVSVKTSTEKIILDVTYKAHQDIPKPVFGFNVYNIRGMNILEGNTIRKKIKTEPMSAGDTAVLSWEFTNMLASDTYSVSVSSCNQEVTEFYDWYNEAAHFIVPKEGNTAAFTDPPIKATYKLNKKR
jgi:ABC-2 type transport system ATP-binding protein